MHGNSETVKVDASKLLFELVIIDRKVFGKIKEVGLDQIISIIPSTNNSEVKFSLLAILANGCGIYNIIYKLNEFF